MDKIKSYIDSLFLGIEPTNQIKKLKEDLLASSEDRYEDLKTQGKSENEAVGAVINEFGTIDELLEEIGLDKNYSHEETIDSDAILLNSALDFLKIYRKSATQIGLGVLFILVGLATMFAAMALLGSTLGEAIGLVGLFLGIALGIPLFIIAGVSTNTINKKLNDRFIPTRVKDEILTRKERFQKSYLFCMVAGVVLCILSVVPLIFLTELSDAEFYENLGLSFLMLFCGIAVFFFIFGGVIMLSFNKLINHTYFIADENKLGPNAKNERQKKKKLNGY